mmetsp:Transcript_49264/g.127046  ORF Transcript_49264/g.127046 Transcript_49264/m.127046 type:complete len:217 (-) Transcript_49264:147-797(-)
MARLIAQRPADEREAVGPLTTATRPGLEELARVVVAREAGLAPARVAQTNLHGACSIRFLHLVGGRATHTLSVSGAAGVAVRGVRPREELVLEPLEQWPHEGELVGLVAFGGQHVHGHHRDLVQGVPLQLEAIVLLHVLQMVDLRLQPLGRVAELRLQQGGVLLLHQLVGLRTDASGCDLELIFRTHVAQHDHGGSHSRRRCTGGWWQQHVSAHGT